MNERISTTTHQDAPLTSAYRPDATAVGLTDTREDDELTGRTVTINRPLGDVYGFLRNPVNVEAIFAGEDADRHAVRVEDAAGNAVLWHSGADEDRISGRFEAREAPGGRGTEVVATLAQEQRSLVGKAVDLVRKRDPGLQTRRGLRRLKQLLETGEIATAKPGPAAPRGE